MKVKFATLFNIVSSSSLKYTLGGSIKVTFAENIYRNDHTTHANVSLSFGNEYVDIYFSLSKRLRVNCDTNSVKLGLP